MSDGPGSSELAIALRRISDRVEERSRDGTYALGIDRQLAERFNELVGESQPGAGWTELEAAVRALLAHPGFDRSSIVTSSRLPGGSTIHDVIGKAVARQTNGALQQVQSYRSYLEVVVTRLMQALETAVGERDMHYRSALDRLAEVEDLGARYRLLEQRIGALEEGMVGTPPT